MNVYHMPVSREDRQELSDLMTSLKVMWTLLKVPHATIVKGNNCVVGPEDKVNQNFGSQRLERKASLGVSRTKTPKPEVPKYLEMEEP
jgi:hypothetical protein